MSLALYLPRVRSSDLLGVIPLTYQILNSCRSSKVVWGFAQLHPLHVAIVSRKGMSWKAYDELLRDSRTSWRMRVKEDDAINLSTDLQATRG